MNIWLADLTSEDIIYIATRLAAGSTDVIVYTDAHNRVCLSLKDKAGIDVKLTLREDSWDTDAQILRINLVETLLWEDISVINGA